MYYAVRRLILCIGIVRRVFIQVGNTWFKQRKTSQQNIENNIILALQS